MYKIETSAHKVVVEMAFGGYEVYHYSKSNHAIVLVGYANTLREAVEMSETTMRGILFNVK